MMNINTTYRNPLKVYAALIFSSGHKCCT